MGMAGQSSFVICLLPLPVLLTSQRCVTRSDSGRQMKPALSCEELYRRPASARSALCWLPIRGSRAKPPKPVSVSM